MYDYKKIIPFGYYKENPVYYGLNEGSLKVSQLKEIPYKINGWVLSVVLVALPIMQKISSSATVLKGGADQILLSQDWPLEWISDFRIVPN